MGKASKYNIGEIKEALEELELRGQKDLLAYHILKELMRDEDKYLEERDSLDWILKSNSLSSIAKVTYTSNQVNELVGLYKPRLMYYIKSAHALIDEDRILNNLTKLMDKTLNDIYPNQETNYSNQELKEIILKELNSNQ